MTAIPVNAAGPTTPPLSPSSFVLIWAPWCAPCRVEISVFDRLASTAHPRDTIVLSTSDDGRSKAMLAPVPAAKLRFTQEALPALYKRLGIRGPVALPLSLMTDAKGQICAVIRGGATVPSIERAKQECDAADPL